MLKILKRKLLPIFGIWAVVRFLLDNWGRLQELHDFFNNRGALIKWAGLILTSQWLPVGLFVAAVLALVVVHFDLIPPKKKTSDLEQSTLRSGRLRISCHPSIEGCVKETRFTSELLPTNFFRAKVESEGGRIQNCTGFLTRIERDGQAKWAGDSAKLTFAQGEEADTFSKTIRSKVAEFLDVLAVSNRGTIYPGTYQSAFGRIWPYVPSLSEIFSEPGDYILTIAVTGDDVPTETALLKFTWTQNWQSSLLTLVAESPQAAAPRPRTISFDQESQMIKLLKGVSLRPIWITTRIGARENDKEAYDYAMQLTRAFMKAGVPIEGQASVDVGTLFPPGVSVFWKKAIYNEVTASSIIEAVRITGVQCKEVDRQVCPAHAAKEPEINLMIGSNKPNSVRGLRHNPVF